MGMFSQTRTRSPDCAVSTAVDRLLPPSPLPSICIRTVPVGDVLVGDAGGDIEHDDAALAVDVVAITETAELLLAGGVPHIELDRTEVLRALLVSGHPGALIARSAGGRYLRC